MTTDAESRYDVALSFAGAQRVYVALAAGWRTWAQNS